MEPKAREIAMEAIVELAKSRDKDPQNYESRALTLGHIALAAALIYLADMTQK